VYLHRTARDYLEQPNVWSRILDSTAKSDFDACFSLLMSYVVQVKTSPVQDLFGIGQELLFKIAYLELSATPATVQLVDELDKALSYRSLEKGRTSHWSNNHSRWKDNPNPPPWEGDIISMAIQCDLIWYARAKVSYGASLAYMAAKAGLPLPYALPKKRRGLPLLAYAVSFHTWCFDGRALLYPKHPTPNGNNGKCHIQLVEDLLRNGSDPNEIFQGYSIWEYIIYWVHSTTKLEERETWLTIFMLMLQHGADPHACCVSDAYCFLTAVGDRADSVPPNSAVAEHLSIHRDNQGQIKRGCDPQSWDAGNPHFYFHSVTAVVDDIFERPSMPRYKELKTLLELKKKTWPRLSRKGTDNTSNNIAFRPSDWVS